MSPVLLRHNLETVRSSVDTAMRGDGAEVRLQEQKPDLVVLDGMLPGVSGIELRRRIRARADAQTMPVIMFTARILPAVRRPLPRSRRAGS